MPSRVQAIAAVMVVGALALGGPARASTFAATDLSQDNALLSEFNLINLGNYTQSASQTIQGRAIIGGNATFAGSSFVCSANCTGNTTTAIDSSGASFGALTVFGNFVGPGGYTAVSANSGDANVAGTSTGNIHMNNVGKFDVVGSASGTNVVNATAIRTTQSSFAGGSYATSDGVNFGPGVTAQVSQTLASVFPFTSSYSKSVAALSRGIANLPGSPGVSTQALPPNENAFLVANADYIAGGKKYGVVTTTLANLASGTGNGGINNNGNDATFVIVRGDGNYTLPNLNSYSGGGSNKIIYDFVDATTLQFSGAWNASILAPLATITQQNGAITGTVIVASINQTQELFDASNGGGFMGDLSGLAGISTNTVPEPASLALLGFGAAAAGWVRRRKTSTR